jgi:hypothetical protein
VTRTDDGDTPMAKNEDENIQRDMLPIPDRKPVTLTAR